MPGVWHEPEPNLSPACVGEDLVITSQRRDTSAEALMMKLLTDRLVQKMPRCWQIRIKLHSSFAVTLFSYISGYIDIYISIYIDKISGALSCVFFTSPGDRD